jgi:hypothetical protein
MAENDDQLAQNTILLGELDYRAAIDIVIAQAEHELLIFDQDLALGDYASLKRTELIRTFLTKAPSNKVVIVLQDARYFMHSCPRLFSLLEMYGHKMTVYETDNAAKVAKDCFLVADQSHYIRRFHIDQARFKYALNDIDTSAMLNLRFEELLQAACHKISPINLGL